jgi:hypothetical protein
VSGRGEGSVEGADGRDGLGASRRVLCRDWLCARGRPRDMRSRNAIYPRVEIIETTGVACGETDQREQIRTAITAALEQHSRV